MRPEPHRLEIRVRYAEVDRQGQVHSSRYPVYLEMGRTEMQAAVGLAQLEKLPAFAAARKKNWARLRRALEKYSGSLLLPEPAPRSDPSWFGFLITVKAGAGFTRDQLVAHLERNKVQTRMLFAGNLVKHPCFDAMRASGRGFRTVAAPSRRPASALPVTDRVMNGAFWLGVYPGLTGEMLGYVIKTFEAFFRGPLGSR